MTERTFRTPSPSPSRQASRSEPVAHPPVPALPQNYANSPTTAPKPKNPKQRAASQDSYAPRLSSPPGARPNKQRQGPDFLTSRPQQQQASPIQRRPDLALANDLERTDSRNSINFSRPLSPRPQSPIARPQSPIAQSPVAQSPMLTNGDRFPPSVVASISPAQADDIQYGLSQVANQPVKKKKKKVATYAAEGSHLHGGTMASKPVVTPLEPGPTYTEQPFVQDQQQVVPKKKKKKKVAVTGENSHFSDIQSSETSNADYSYRPDSDSDSNTERTKDKRAQRASGVLQKQPSIVKEDWEGEQNEQAPLTHTQNGAVLGQSSTQPIASPTPPTARTPPAANVSRKINEPASAPDTFVQPAGVNYHALTTAEQLDSSPASSTSLQVQAPQAVRGSSLSPSRSTRFSDRLSSDLAAGRKHDPLPRSVSPAKSALKHHSPAPSGSPLDPNFKPRGASATPSETSDISTTEAETFPKRKKSARVSFDAAPETVAPPPSAEAVESPSKEKRSWLGMGKSKPTLSTIPSNDDMEELMKPRPQLPSFGSVRGQKSRDGNETATAARSISTENHSQTSEDSKMAPSSAASSETSSSSFNHAPPLGVSNDHLVGAILAQDSQKARGSVGNEPLPPEVTSVEGVVSFSDSENDSSDEEAEHIQDVATQPVPASGTPVQREAEPITSSPITTQAPSTSSRIELPPPVEVPVLSLSPPTPALEQTKQNDQWEVEVPGGFPVSFDALAQLNSSSKADTGTGELATSSRGLGVVAPSESESDNDSIYSDAAEDPSELDGTGFGSIDAIVDSPVVTSPSTRLATVPESPLARVSNAPLPEAPPSPSWEATQARWSNIAEQTKHSPPSIPVAQQPVQDGTQPRAVVPNHAQPAPQILQQRVQQPQPAQPKKKKKKMPPQSGVVAPVPAALIAARGVVPDSAPRQQNQPSAYPSIHHQRVESSPPAQHFRQSMRTTSPPAPEPTFRQSLRNENRTPMSSATNQPKQKRVPQPAPSAVSAAQAQAKPAPQPRAALQKKYIPPQSSAAAPAATIQKQRLPPPPIPSNDSDSDSSFRRARRSKSTSGGQYTMRRSMRGTAGAPSHADPRNGVRSVSPVGRRPFSPPAGPHTMRTSMRGSMDNTPTLRGSTDTKRSSSLFGRRQSSQPPQVPAVSTTGFASKMRSRIVDSDDEDDYTPKPTKWRSRFADDSDDEDPGFTPVRGIPRRANDSDSTDLEDSSDEEKAPVRAPAKLAVSTNNITTPSTGGVPQSPTSPQKRGLFGRFRSKKPKEEASSPVVESPPAPPKQEKTKASQLGFSSTAERDRIIEQTRARLEATQNGPVVAASPPASSHGKLQRRHIPQRVMSDSWPLPPKIPDDVDHRPGTAESAPVRNGSTRLAEGSMRGYHDAAAVGKSGKKKRFPMLRKAFGLKD